MKQTKPFFYSRPRLSGGSKAPSCQIGFSNTLLWLKNQLCGTHTHTKGDAHIPRIGCKRHTQIDARSIGSEAD